MSRVKILAPRTKEAQNGGKEGWCFVKENSFLVVTGQVGMKFGNKRQSVSSIEP